MQTQETELSEWKPNPELIMESIKSTDPLCVDNDGNLKRPIGDYTEDILRLLSIPEFKSVSDAYLNIVDYRRNYNKKSYEDVVKSGVKENIDNYKAINDYPYGLDDSSFKDELLEKKYEDYKEYNDLQKEFSTKKSEIIKMMREKDLGSIWAGMFEIASVYADKDKIVL